MIDLFDSFFVLLPQQDSHFNCPSTHKNWLTDTSNSVLLNPCSATNAVLVIDGPNAEDKKEAFSKGGFGNLLEAKSDWKVGDNFIYCITLL